MSAYTADLFSKLEQMGKGTVSKTGRQIKFVANLTPPPITPELDEVKAETPPPGDRVTVAETTDISTLEVSPTSELSLVTLENSVVAEGLIEEVPEEAEEAIATLPPVINDPEPTKVRVDEETPQPIVEVVPEKTQQFQAGDRIWHPEYGSGIIAQICENMASCTFDEVRNSIGELQRNAKRSPYIHELNRLAE